MCVAHDLPALFHVSPGFHPLLYSRPAHPLEFDAVAADFPRLAMLMGHAGREWWVDCLTMAQAHPNMVLELAGWQTRLRDEPEGTVQALDRMRRGVGVERIIWGSDFPAARAHMALAETVEVYRCLPETAARFGVRFTTADVAALLGGNAARLLKLPPASS